MKRAFGSFFVFSSLLVCVAHASAITVQLADASLTGAPGDTLQFFATLSNPSSTDTIYLNGIGSTAASPFLNVETTPFDINAPLFLGPGDVSGPFELFDVAIDPSTPDGPYVGGFLSILGGADGGQGTAFDDLADINFDIDVSAGASATAPEPESGAPVLAALLILCAWRRRRASR